MERFKDDHRGYTIFPHVTWTRHSGAFEAAWAAGRLEDGGTTVRVTLQGAAPKTYEDAHAAEEAAAESAKKAIDAVLDGGR